MSESSSAFVEKSVEKLSLLSKGFPVNGDDFDSAGAEEVSPNGFGVFGLEGAPNPAIGSVEGIETSFAEGAGSPNALPSSF